MFNLYIQQRDAETSQQLNIASKFRSTDAERFYKTLVTRYNRSFYEYQEQSNQATGNTAESSQI